VPTSPEGGYTQVSFPRPIASKLFPLRVRLSFKTETESSLISLSDVGVSSSSTSTHPFQPFLAAYRFFRWRGSSEAMKDGLESSSSSGVCGRLDEVRDVPPGDEGPGVDCGEDGMGGGVIERGR